MPTKNTPSVVLLKQGNGPVIKEGTASEEIYPAELVDTDDKEAIALNTADAGTKVPLTVAKEEGFVGKDLDEPYSADDNVKFYCLLPYQEAQVYLADGENVAKGDILTPDGAEFIAFDSGAGHEFKAVRALEDLDNSTAGEATRIKVEVLA